MILCGTGHRPNKLGGYGKDVQDKLVDVARSALRELQPSKVITGMALGWDQALAIAAQRLAIPYVAAIPFDGQEKAWPKESQRQWREILDDAIAAKVVCPGGYAAWKMQERNKWMVDNAHMVLALWNGTPGGTANCVQYAEKTGKKLVNVWEKYKCVS